MHGPGMPAPRTVITAILPALLCSGCHMLGALFEDPWLGGTILVVVAVAAIALLVSKSGKR